MLLIVLAYISIPKKTDVKTPNIQDETLLGIDADNDGVRDDMQEWVEQKFSENLNLKNGILQRLRYMQLELKNFNNKKLSIKYSKMISKSKACMGEVDTSLSGNDRSEITVEILKRYYNTKERIQAFRKINENFHGQILTSFPRDEALSFCEFEIVKTVKDPGEEGKKTLLGIDADNDGVRDDVQVWIDNKFFGNDNLRKSFRQIARSIQKEFSLLKENKSTIAATHEKLNSYKCLISFLGDTKPKAKKEIYDSIDPIIYNTKTRVQAALKISQQFNGEIIPIEHDDINYRVNCKF